MKSYADRQSELNPHIPFPCVAPQEGKSGDPAVNRPSHQTDVRSPLHHTYILWHRSFLFGIMQLILPGGTLWRRMHNLADSAWAVVHRAQHIVTAG